MAELPHGTVTLVFTDIEGSTRLLTSLGSRYEAVLADHRRLLRDAFSSHAGIEVDTQGDALFYAFAKAHDAITAAVAAQRALSSHDLGQAVELRVRMGIHSGEPTVTKEGYVGPDVHLGARICAAAWGAQIVVSSATAGLLSSGLEDITLRSLGDHALKDIEQRTELFQVVAPGLTQDFPALRTKGTHPTNLPPRLASLIGRQQDLAALEELLGPPQTSVVTLTGPGGTGKTSLAAALGAQLLSSFPDGVFFVDLSALNDPSLVIAALAQALALKESPGRTLHQSLAAHLSSKEMLVILDNFEQVIDAAPEVSALLTEAPSLKVVVTSREALRIQGERVVSLAPLELPSPEHDDVDEVARSAAVALFTERARAVKQDFTLTADNAAEVAAICRRLDGLPLALELAAARINLLSPSALLARLDHGLKLLTSGRRDATQRQRTLRGAISWSYELLPQDEQRLFYRLGVFAGGWSLQAAEQVCDRGDLTTDVLDGLASLVDKSLVRAAGEQERFSVLETIREFSLEKLEESGEAEEIKRAHAVFVARLVESEYPNLQGSRQAAALDVLEQEHANVESALQWSVMHESHGALEIASYTWRFWLLRGYLTIAMTWLDAVLSHTRAPSAVCVRALRGLSTIAALRGDTETSLRAAREAVDFSRTLKDDAALSRSLECLAGALTDDGDLETARRYYHESLRLYEKLEDERGVAVALINLGYVALLESKLPDARDLFERSFDTHDRIGDKEGASVALENIANTLLASGDLCKATSSFRKALAFAAELGYREGMANALEGVAAVLGLESRFGEAALVMGASERLRAGLGSSREPFEQTTYERTMDLLRKSVASEKLDILLNRGKLSVDGVIQHQLQVTLVAEQGPVDYDW